jgi:cytochrome P450
MSASFTPRAIADLEESVRHRAAGIMEEAAAGPEEFDFATVAAELPTVTLATLLGVPMSDRGLMTDWANRVIGYQDDEYAGRSTVDPAQVSDIARQALALWPDLEIRPGEEPLNPRSPQALADMFEYARLLADHKRTNPGNDVMSILLRLQEDGGVTEAEFQNMFFLIVVAGNETLRNGIPGGLLSLMDHPDQLGLLEQNRDLLDGAVEEMLRFFPPGIHFRRTARVDVELGGQTIQAGEKVVVYFASANRDETVFPEPDRFDITRSPNEHLSFGFGPHLCLGAHLARIQMRAIFDQFFDRFERVELAGEPVRLVSNFHNALKHLPVRAKPRRTSSSVGVSPVHHH